MRYQCLIPFTMLCFSFLALSGCTEKQQVDPRTSPPLVRVATVKENSVSASRAFTGVVKARIESNLGFRISGKIVKRFVDTGQTVKRGQLLMQIDASDLQLAAKAQQQSVDAARAQAQQAIKDEQRYRNLLGSGAISTSTYDQIEATADAAKAQLSSAQDQAKVSANASTYANLVADRDGTIMETLVEPGQVVSAGQTVLRLAHLGQKEAVIQLPETVRPHLGSIGQAKIFGENNTTFSAKLRQLSNTADPLTRTFEARFTLEGIPETIPLGSTVTIQLEQQDSQHILEIPLGALLDKGNETGVWVINPKTQKVTWRAVVIKRMSDEYAYVTGHIQQGEKIVALGAHLLREGAVIRSASNQKEENHA